MKSAPVLIAVLATTLPACGSNQTGNPSSSSQKTASTWDPPATPEGYTRITSKTVKDVPPGGDVTYCQYVMAPLDHDVDVLEVSGYQSAFGHHAVALTYVPAAGEEPGSSFPCMGTEFSAGPTDGGAASSVPKTGGGLSVGAFLGAVGGAGGGRSSTSLPEGVAFRFKQGQGIMLNVHYLNTGEEAIDGNAVVDLKFADPDPTRTIASMFLNLNFGFSVAPSAQTTSTIDCVAQSDVKIIMMANHMHEHGTSAITEVIPTDGGAPQTLHEDKTWAFDMQFNPVFSHWDVGTPFTIHSGDTVRTTCNWDNTTATAMTFPREMCLGVGFALATGDNPTVPVCFNGSWTQNGL